MTNRGKDAIFKILFRVKANPGKRPDLLKFLKWDRNESLHVHDCDEAEGLFFCRNAEEKLTYRRPSMLRSDIHRFNCVKTRLR